MKCPLFWHPSIKNDIASITSFIANDSIREAQRVAEAIDTAIRELKNFPHQGKPYLCDIPQLEGIRRILVP